MKPNANVSTGYQYPYPPEPTKWGFEERQFSQGLRHLFDILFSRKLQNILIGDGAVNGRTIAKESISLRHLVKGFGKDLDISENAALAALGANVTDAQDTAGAAKDSASEAKAEAASATTAAGNAQATANSAVTAAGNAQATANAALSAVGSLPDALLPVGTIVMMDTAPTFGAWESYNLGLQDVTAWKRTA